MVRNMIVQIKKKIKIISPQLEEIYTYKIDINKPEIFHV